MSGAAAVSAAKNRRSREQPPAPTQTKQQQQQQQQQKQEKPRELTLIEALHQHDFRLRRSEEALKHLLSIETANAEKNSSASGSNDVQDTLDLFNERILSLEKYIDDELAKSLTLKEQEDKEGEDVIYGKINGLETLLKDLKSELVRIQSASRDTSVSFLKYKGDTDTQLKELKDSVKSLTAAVKELQTPPVAYDVPAVPFADE